MRKELEDKLFENYPDFFKHKDDTTRSLMRYGFTHGDGWYYLVEGILVIAKDKLERWRTARKYVVEEGKDYDWAREILEACPEEPIFEVEQVKEKFGGLRFYSSGTIDVWDAIRLAEYVSFTICEVCGGRGSVRPNAWIRTLCDTCATVK